jgi:hypothetical protein
VLPLAFDKFQARRRLVVNGEITLCGQPIIHVGAASFLREDQACIYQQLAYVRDHALIASLHDGVITKLYATHPSTWPALNMMQALFTVDSRYRILWEIGIGLNSTLKLLSGNHAMNEMFGGENGTVHWGFGLTPYTQYHMDFICPSTRIFGDNGTVLIGPPDKESYTRQVPIPTEGILS